jgi:GT2 family glycosyltransferase
MISIAVLTHDRVHLLARCVENVLARTSELTTEIVIWNNGSTDDTRAYLEGLADPRIAVVHHPENIGQNAYAEAFAMTSGDYLIDLDDDMIDAPPEWDRRLLEAFRALPEVGFLAANLVDDPNDVAAHTMYRVRPHLYTRVTINGVDLLRGPVGGGCAITSRVLHDRVGGFEQRRDRVFFLEDEAYIAKIEKLGYEAAYLADLKLHHAGGPHYASLSPEKQKFWLDYERSTARKKLIKRLILKVPFARRLNRRYRWFEPPDEDLAAA